MPRSTVTRLQLVADHLVREVGDALELIDTGSPISMDAPADAKRHVSPRLTRVVGMDELGASPLVLDWSGLTLEQGAEKPVGANCSALETVMGVPSTAFSVHLPSGMKLGFALLDTGAPLGYAPAESVAGLRETGTFEDFYPGMGTFTTPVYDVEVELLGARQTVKVGVLPPLLRMALSLLGPERWVLGADFFRGRRLYVDVKGGEIADVQAGR